MMLIASKPQTSLIPEGSYPATLSTVTGLPDEQKPKKVALGFKIDGQTAAVTKELPASLDANTPLRKDVETIRGSELTASEALAGLDITKLIGQRCQVVVMHKVGSGGKPKAVVSLVQALPKTV
jgi:hypothetical protein